MNPPTTSSILLRSSITAALGGLLFGFDTVVISGAEKTIQSLWGLSDGIHGLAVSMALWGTVLGAMIGGWPTEKFGRKNTLVAIGIMYFVSALWSGFAIGPWDFMIARFIGGMGIGISTVVSPLYISEIAPAERRGRLTGLYQFNIVAAPHRLPFELSDRKIPEQRYRMALDARNRSRPRALLYPRIPHPPQESPRWLLTRGKRPEATGILRRLDPTLSDQAANLRIDEISAADEESKTGIQIPFLSKPLLRPIALAFLIAFFNQLSGINAILYYAPRIFALTGLGEQAALLQSVGIGVTNFVFTFVGLALIDRVGREPLLLVGSVGYIGSLGLCSWAFFTGTYGVVPAALFGFIAAHAVGQGAVIWVFISEIFPTATALPGSRSVPPRTGSSPLCSPSTFPLMVGSFAPGYVFAFFAGMMALQLVWVVGFVPETRGIPLEKVFSNLR